MPNTQDMQSSEDNSLVSPYWIHYMVVGENEYLRSYHGFELFFANLVSLRTDSNAQIIAFGFRTMQPSIKEEDKK